MLANGTLAIGDEALSKRLIAMSRALIPSVFSDCNIFTASAYFLMSHYYLRIGDISQGMICVEFTKGLSEILVMKSPQNFTARLLKILCLFAFAKPYRTL